ncbi:MAG: PEP-CTERM sorting domain-containing protein [Thermoguttaceae bacterium]|nr:PEP-CTERM sorting domain-containing protein [Thermoguttaceae bacterium]
MLYKRFQAVLPVLLLILAPATGAFAQTTVHSGDTLPSGSVSSWPIIVESGGTLQNSVASANLGSASQTITISGTGNGTISSTDTTPLGAIYSAVTCGMGQGVFANVEISGSAATTCNNQRLRFQGNVTGGTLTTYSLGGGGETHAGYNSSFNIQKLIIAKGNFTFNAKDGNALHVLSHVFTDGIEVQNGGTMRLWDASQGISLYSDAAKTTLSTITLDAGGTFLVQDTDAKINANLTTAGNSSLTLDKSLTWLSGTISGTGVLTIGSSQTLTANSGVSITAPLQLSGGSKLTLNSGSTQSGAINLSNGTLNFSGTSTDTALTVARGTVNFNTGSTFSGSINYGTFTTGYEPSININSGSTLSLTDNSSFNSTLKTLSGTVSVAAGKTLTLQGADTSANATAGTITLNEGATLKVTQNTTSKLNAAVKLDGNASILLDAQTDDTQGKAFLTVNSIDAAGKTLTFAKANRPGGTLTADSITVGKLQMNNSLNLVVNDLTGSIVTYRVNDFNIKNSLTLGTDGVTKGYTDNSTCSFTFGDGATVKLSGASATIASSYGNYNVNLNGTLNVDLPSGKTLTWKNSNFVGNTSTTNKIVKTGAGMLNLLPAGSSNISEVQLNGGITNLSGTLNAQNVILADGAILSPGSGSGAIGTGKIVGNLDADGTINLGFNSTSNDLLEITGTADFTDATISLIWLGGDTIPEPGKTYTFLQGGTLNNLDLNSVLLTESVAQYFSSPMFADNLLTLTAIDPSVDPSVPEPTAWVLLMMGLVGIGSLRRNKRCAK